jgi:polygalacturonase
VIDGQGASFEGPYKVRPYMIRMIECRDVVVEGVTIRNSPMWVQHYLACDDVRLSGLTVKSLVNHNNDGIDIDSCRRVVISGCNIESGDDAIVLKSTSDRVCEDVVVSGCVLRSECNGLKMGTESHGGFRNIVLTGCAIWDTRLAGVALEIVDGGIMDRIVVSDITMKNVAAPIFVRLGHRARIYREGMAKPGVGVLRNVTICNIEGTGTSDVGLAISGVPEAKIENLTLSGIRLSLPGGGDREAAARAVAENVEAYPEFKMFGKLPAYGFYCRHVNGLKLADVHLQLAGADGRHAVVFEDVEQAVVDGLEVPYSNGAASLLRLANVRNVTVRDSVTPEGTEVFLTLEGAGSDGVTLMGNDFRGAETIAEVDEAVAESALTMMGNVKDCERNVCAR